MAEKALNITVVTTDQKPPKNIAWYQTDRKQKSRLIENGHETSNNQPVTLNKEIRPRGQIQPKIAANETSILKVHLFIRWHWDPRYPSLIRGNTSPVGATIIIFFLD